MTSPSLAAAADKVIFLALSLVALLALHAHIRPLHSDHQFFASCNYGYKRHWYVFGPLCLHLSARGQPSRAHIAALLPR